MSFGASSFIVHSKSRLFCLLLKSGGFRIQGFTVQMNQLHQILGCHNFEPCRIGYEMKVLGRGSLNPGKRVVTWISEILIEQHQK